MAAGNLETEQGKRPERMEQWILRWIIKTGLSSSAKSGLAQMLPMRVSSTKLLTLTITDAC